MVAQANRGVWQVASDQFPAVTIWVARSKPQELIDLASAFSCAKVLFWAERLQSKRSADIRCGGELQERRYRRQLNMIPEVSVFEAA
ncbi:MAG: hypothetical protein OXG78_00950 [Chloroflexi bacterium]|nr:hypothetical protein [Chloroflexota bacterium]